MSTCCVHPKASEPKGYASDFAFECLDVCAVFVHCIVHFPCTILQVAIVLNFM